MKSHLAALIVISLLMLLSTQACEGFMDEKSMSFGLLDQRCATTFGQQFNTMSDHHVVLGYWPSRGRAEVARNLLAYTSTKWEDVTYKNGADWFGKDKKNLGLPLPNIPYLIDGDFKLTESLSIYSYIAKRFGKPELMGKNLQDEASVFSLMMVNYDIDHLLVSLFWDPDWKSKVEKNLEKGGQLLRKVADVYGEKDTALSYLTVADFQYAEQSYYIEKISPELYKELPFLNRVRKLVDKLPEVQAYRKEKGTLPFVEEGDLKF